jgi:competence protein ComEC
MKKTPFKIILSIILIILNYFVWQSIFDVNDGNGLLKITFLDVGQGDSILIDDSFGNQLLIDGGDGASILERIDEHLPFYDRTIAAVLLTHPDSDHLGGILKVLEAYNVENFFYTGLKKDSKTYDTLVKLLEESKLDMTIVRQGQVIELGNEAKLFILYPESLVSDLELEDFNEYSIVSKLVFGDFEALFPGDAGRLLEAKLLNSGIDLTADLLKIGHHGSRHSTHSLFLMKVDPDIAVISVGENSYGHPHPDTLERLGDILTRRTDLGGNIEVVTDGDKVWIGD